MLETISWDSLGFYNLMVLFYRIGFSYQKLLLLSLKKIFRNKQSKLVSSIGSKNYSQTKNIISKKIFYYTIFNHIFKIFSA